MCVCTGNDCWCMVYIYTHCMVGSVACTAPTPTDCWVIYSCGWLMAGVGIGTGGGGGFWNWSGTGVLCVRLEEGILESRV